LTKTFEYAEFVSLAPCASSVLIVSRDPFDIAKARLSSSSLLLSGGRLDSQVRSVLVSFRAIASCISFGGGFKSAAGCALLTWGHGYHANEAGDGECTCLRHGHGSVVGSLIASYAKVLPVAFETRVQ
jgi:hypothetical protein